ncbi:hypothetical protein HY522_06375, partial [bacterium]|nr:hypothetical protein [bacterium]
GKAVEISIRHEDGTTETVSSHHTLTAEQIDWFRAGSALSHFRNVALAAKPEIR